MISIKPRSSMASGTAADENGLADFLLRVANKMDEDASEEKEISATKTIKGDSTGVTLDLDLEDCIIEAGTKSGVLDISSIVKCEGAELAKRSNTQGQVDENGLADFLLRVANKMDEDASEEKEISATKTIKGDSTGVTLDLDLEDCIVEAGTKSGVLDISSVVKCEGAEHAKGSNAQGQAESLEDLVRKLKQDIKSSDTWLRENTAEKWQMENPELAEAYMKAIAEGKDKNFDFM